VIVEDQREQYDMMIGPINYTTTEQEIKKSLPITQILWKVEPSHRASMSYLDLQVARRIRLGGYVRPTPLVKVS